MRYLFLFFLISPFLQAQEPIESANPKKAHYTNSFLSGGSVGGAEELWGMSISTFHGIEVQRWRFLVGVGLDGYYDWLTYPLMGSVSLDAIKGKKNGMLYFVINSGYALANKTQQMEWVSTFSDSGGMIFNPMIGYRVKVDRVTLYFQAGYKNQKVAYSYSYDYGGWGNVPGYSNTFSVDQDLNRFVFQIGFGF